MVNRKWTWVLLVITALTLVANVAFAHNNFNNDIGDAPGVSSIDASHTTPTGAYLLGQTLMNGRRLGSNIFSTITPHHNKQAEGFEYIRTFTQVENVCPALQLPDMCHQNTAYPEDIYAYFRVTSNKNKVHIDRIIPENSGNHTLAFASVLLQLSGLHSFSQVASYAHTVYTSFASKNIQDTDGDGRTDYAWTRNRFTSLLDWQSRTAGLTDLPANVAVSSAHQNAYQGHGWVAEVWYRDLQLAHEEMANLQVSSRIRYSVMIGSLSSTPYSFLTQEFGTTHATYGN